MKQTKLEKELEYILKIACDTEMDEHWAKDKILALFEKHLPKKIPDGKLLVGHEEFSYGYNQAIDDMKKALKGE